MVRENGNAFANAYKYIKEQNEAEANKYQSAIAEATKKHQDTLDKIYNIRESRELARRNHNKLLEDCRNDALGTVIKAIYIEALVPGSLTDNALFLAESMVDGWIQEKGGASRIIGSCKNTSYLLNRICSIVEEVAEDNVEEIEADESDGKTVEEKKAEEEDKKAKVTQMLAQANSLIAKATALQNGDESVLNDTEEETATDNIESSSSDDVIDADAPVEEEKDDTESNDEKEFSDDEIDPDFGEEEASEESDNSEDKESEEKSDKEETIEDNDESEESDESDDEESEESDDDDDDEKEFSDDEIDPDFGDTEDIEKGENEDQQEAEEELTGESLDDETVEDDEEEEIEDTSVDGENTEPQGKIFDELDKEEDVRKAVQLIRQRVADAEEDFIKRNAEDKKQIDDLLGKISDNIKTVEDLSNDDSAEGQAKTKIAQESTMMLKRKIKNITENRPQSVFERMARKLTEGITKDSDIRAMYLAESGRTDMASVVETTKVMYGFLEALRTLQLEKVDAAYIENVLKEM